MAFKSIVNGNGNSSTQRKLPNTRSLATSSTFRSDLYLGSGERPQGSTFPGAQGHIPLDFAMGP